MKNHKILILVLLGIILSFNACKAPLLNQNISDIRLPDLYGESKDSISMALKPWKTFFNDPYLIDLIEYGLKNNQELNIILQEIEISKNEVRDRKGEYLPFVGFKAVSGVEKVGRYTSQGANDANTEILEGKEFPEPLNDYIVGLEASWEIDIWKKLRNSKKAAVSRYLSSIEGKHFMQTHLISEIAKSYYELLGLDNELLIINQNIEIQKNALKVIEYQKLAAKTTELAVQRFKAEVYKTQSLLYEITQKITETENKLNFLLGRIPQMIVRDSRIFNELTPIKMSKGIPANLLENRPDIRAAQLNLEAQKLDVKVAKARFYPSLGISAGVGLQAFDTKYLSHRPESLIYHLVGDLAGPILNRNAIKAQYLSANAKQLQSVITYNSTVLNAFIEVSNLWSKIENMEQQYELKSKEVEAMIASVNISNKLFRSARADYMEVLLTQREALESKFELVETKVIQMNSFIELYKSLGGGWK